MRGHALFDSLLAPEFAWTTLQDAEVVTMSRVKGVRYI
jgi:hypothetical protein